MRVIRAFTSGLPTGIVPTALAAVLAVAAASADPWADASPAVEYGPGAGFGQAFYPDNILGPPDPGATPSQPAYTEDELLTLGKDGWVVLQFVDNTIVDGDGPDFTVFENVMQSGSSYFRETAFVDVSQDGVNWVRFPWDPVTFDGLAGVWPTTGGDPTDPSVSGGDQFDLADVGMPWVSFVKLTDCGDSVEDGGLFDLDAVVAVNSVETGIGGTGPDAPRLICFSPATTGRIELFAGTAGNVMVFDLDGRLEFTCPVSPGMNSIAPRDGAMTPGVRFLVFGEQGTPERASASVVVLR